MAAVLHRATLALHTALGTPLAGDTLFGHLCWALRESAGEAELARRLDGYAAGQPWLVVSNGFPAGYLPRPTLPQHFHAPAEAAARKAAKRNHWVPAQAAGAPLPALLAAAVADEAAYGAAPRHAAQPHNTLNRLTGTTGEGIFAPYTQPQTFHAPGQRIDLYLALDTERVGAGEAQALLTAIGASGFGRDASIGLGKFLVERVETAVLPAPAKPTAYWTLAPCAPQGQGFDGARSFWRVLTRFGRHGNAHALGGRPFKTPVLLAASGAVFTPAGSCAPRAFIGQGLGGDGTLSKAEPATVHQGYAPVLPIAL
jgi:CRISPR-associated protein Csm4